MIANSKNKGCPITCGSIFQSLAAVFKKSLAAVLSQCKPITCGSIIALRIRQATTPLGLSLVTLKIRQATTPLGLSLVTLKIRQATPRLGFISSCT